MIDLWNKDAILYSLDVETFADSNGNGVGDFAGLTAKLDYMHGLNVSCIWLLPCYPTPNRDNGYDIMHFYGVDSRLGSLGEFVPFTRSARERSARVPSGISRLPVVAAGRRDHARRSERAAAADPRLCRAGREGPHDVQLLRQPSTRSWRWRRATANRCAHESRSVLAVHNMSSTAHTVDLPLRPATTPSDLLTREDPIVRDGCVRVTLTPFVYRWFREAPDEGSGRRIE